jgi:glycogen debranching enzyme
MSMIDAYDKKTGDGNWLRQSLQILQEAIDSVQRIKGQMAEEDRGANASGDSATTAQKDLQSRDAG